MATKNVLVKDLQGVETLGAITLLATDKTGTLTRNQMTVTNMWTNLQLLNADTNPGSQRPANEVILSLDIPGVEEIILISSMCSKARFDDIEKSIDQRAITGDATESGLLRFAATKLGTMVDTVCVFCHNSIAFG
jgi:sodium/potassium-transporting ATPase subunit alpha